MRREIGPRLVIATHNAGKLREIAALLAPHGIEPVSAGALGLPEPEETEETFAGNARLKAHAAARASRLTALSDDSGLEVDALGGAPGVRSADWAETGRAGPSADAAQGGRRDFAMAMERLRGEMATAGAAFPSPARFRATLCLAWPDGADLIFEGAAEGQVIWPPRGDRGFGFDPMFVPAGHDRTFGEMAPEEKTPLTHRAAAFAALERWLRDG